MEKRLTLGIKEDRINRKNTFDESVAWLRHILSTIRKMKKEEIDIKNFVVFYINYLTIKKIYICVCVFVFK